MQTHDRAAALISKYLKGQATTAEKEWLEQWFLEMGDAAHLEQGPQTAAGQYKLRERIYDNIQHNILTQQQPGRRLHPLRWWALGAAASLTLLIVANWFWQRTAPPATVAMRTVSTRTGQLSELVLSDSTVVWLNANSHLHFPATFGDMRQVALEGEAYFDVHPDPQHPFLIRSGAFCTKVLGTAFSIRSYAASHSFRVTVSSGKVGVYNPADSTQMILLTANEQLNSEHDALQPNVRHIEAGSYTAWKTGALRFDKERLDDVVQALENRYGQHFIISDNQLASLPVSGAFDKQDKLENVMKILARVYHLRFTHTANGDIAIH